MSEFGVMFVATRDELWSDLLTASLASLPAELPRHVVRCESYDEVRDVRLSLLDHTPFERTLYLDCDTLCLATLEQFDELRSLPLAHGIALRGWRAVNSPWSHPGDWVGALGLSRMADAPDWLLWPNCGVILFDKSAPFLRNLFAAWKASGDRLPNIEPPLVDVALSATTELWDVLPWRWHVPAHARLRPKLVTGYSPRLLHAVGAPTEQKLAQLLQAAEVAT